MSKTLKEYNDEQIMLLIQKGRTEALSELYERYSGKMLNYFYRMLNKDIENARDFLQDLFLKIISNPAAFDCSKKFSVWIYTIAGNMCKNEYRRMSVRNEHKNNVIHQYSGNNSYVDDKIDYNLFKLNLDESLEKIDIKMKEIFLLRFQQDLSIREISEVLNCPEGTIKSRLFNTIKILSGKLKVFAPKMN
jgi:RNA polymerase sigma-70 factor, ECF subfamily